MGMWNFSAENAVDVQSPLSIVEDLCKELYHISGERIIARVTEYSGRYKSVRKPELVFPDQDFNGIHPEEPHLTPEFDVQDVMGDKACDEDHSNKFVYELFLTSKNTPKYKYRVFIMYYGIDMFPVGLTIQSDIAKDANLDSEGTICKGKEEFNVALNLILGSDTIGTVLRNLAVLNA